MCIGFTSKSRRVLALDAAALPRALPAKAAAAPYPVSSSGITTTQAACLPATVAAAKAAYSSHTQSYGYGEQSHVRHADGDYHDLAATTPEEDRLYLERQQAHQLKSNSGAPRPPPGGVGTPFPLKLYRMLDELERTPDGASIIGWQPHGRAFVVHNQKKFVSQIMPKYFGAQTKFASFQRQLNLYNFRRLTTGIDRGGYYHEAFLRGKPYLCHRIQRARVNGRAVRRPANPDCEPNLYALEAVGVDKGVQQLLEQQRSVLRASQPRVQRSHQPVAPAVQSVPSLLQMAMPLMRVDSETRRIYAQSSTAFNPPPQPPPMGMLSTTNSSLQHRPQAAAMEPNELTLMVSSFRPSAQGTAEPPPAMPNAVPSEPSFCPSQDPAASRSSIVEPPPVVSDASDVASCSSTDEDEACSFPEEPRQEVASSLQRQQQEEEDESFEEELSKIFDDQKATTTNKPSSRKNTITTKDADEFFKDFDLPMDLDEMPIDDDVDDVEFGLLLEQVVE